MSSHGVTLTKRKGMTVFKYTQVRKYAFIPADFLLQMKSWFQMEKFKIKKNHRGHGHLSGRRDGIHINFVPKFLISVKQFADHAEVTFSYAARIRKIGAATAILTQGLSIVVGAVTLSSHVAQARGFVDTVTDVMDSISGRPFEVVWTEATEVPGAETATTTTTTTRNVAPTPAVVAPTPPTPAPVVIEKVVEPVAPVVQQQPQIIIVPQSTIVVQAPPQQQFPFPYNMQGMFPSVTDNAFPSHGHMMSERDAPLQIAYQPTAPTISIGDPTVPTMFERPTMLKTTRYPMPSSSGNPFDAPAPVQQPGSLLEIEYPAMNKMPALAPSAFSLTEPMFPKQQPIAAGAPLAYGSARM